MKVKELVYGPPKTGKTLGRSTYPKPLLFLNLDPDGWTSIDSNVEVLEPEQALTRLKSKTPPPKPITVIDFSSAKMMKLQESLHSAPSRAPVTQLIRCVNAVIDSNPFATVVLDSWTGYDSMLMEFILDMDGKQTPLIQHYGMLTRKKEEMVLALLSLDCHVSIVAHETSQKDELTGTVRILPAGMGSFQESMGKYFSQILYSTVEVGASGNRKYVVWTAPKQLVRIVGLRFPQGVPPVVDNNWNEIYKNLK